MFLFSYIDFKLRFIINHMSKRYLFIITAFILLFRISAKAQFADSIALKIKRIEDKVMPQISVEGDEPMTLAERMAFYKVKGLSIAVVHNYIRLFLAR